MQMRPIEDITGRLNMKRQLEALNNQIRDTKIPECRSCFLSMFFRVPQEQRAASTCGICANTQGRKPRHTIDSRNVTRRVTRRHGVERHCTTPYRHPGKESCMISRAASWPLHRRGSWWAPANLLFKRVFGRGLA